MISFRDSLVQEKILSRHDVTRAEEVAAQTSIRLPMALSRLGLLGDDEIVSLMHKTTGYPVLTQLADDCMSAGDLNPDFLRRRALVPLASETAALEVAMADPEDEDAIEALRFGTRRHIKPVIASFSAIERALRSLGIPEDGDDGFSLEPGFDTDLTLDSDVERVVEGNSEAPVIRLVQQLVAEAARRGASDVHFEPAPRSLIIRYRIDGHLEPIAELGGAFTAPVASRIKVMAGLDIAEARLPQDGRMKLSVRGAELDIRVGTAPTVHGESVVLRLLGRSAVPVMLDQLGIPEKALGTLKRALARPHGIVLLTGPTGSGKTTTLYAALKALQRPDVKILTVEDPVEIVLPGINQVQVRPDIDLSYAATLRAFLRQDPDIIMIGEIRDRETAEIAMRAALTGHLVLSTLHTNTALGAFTRLSDLGVEPYLAASTVISTIAQRLVRTLCTDCRTHRAPDPEEQALFARYGIAPPAKIAEPVGCNHCNGSGYRGRAPMIEVIEIDEALRARIRAREDLELGQNAGPETLIGHGLSLVVSGRTSLAEVKRVATTE